MNFPPRGTFMSTSASATMVGLGKMSIPPAGDGRFENQVASPNQKGGLFLKIDLDPKRISILCAD